jgi:hypothetical protein
MAQRDLTLGTGDHVHRPGSGDRDRDRTRLTRRGRSNRWRGWMQGRGQHQRLPGERWLLAASYASVSVALLLIALKCWAWLVSGSASMLGSLIDSVMDSMASLVSMLAVRYSLRPADADHGFGPWQGGAAGRAGTVCLHLWFGIAAAAVLCRAPVAGGRGADDAHRNCAFWSASWRSSARWVWSHCSRTRSV